MAKSWYIPDFLLEKILSRLPVKSLLRFKCVDKSWNDIISSPYFNDNYTSAFTYFLAKRFLRRDYVALIPFPPNIAINYIKIPSELQTLQSYRLDVEGSINGIVCLTFSVGDNDVEIALWNPATRDIKVLPQCDFDKMNPCTSVSFCFDATTNDYKILQVWDGCLYFLYSLRNDYWKILDVPRREGHTTSMFNLLIKNKNIICWLDEIDDTQYDCHVWQILYCDLNDEKFDIIQLSPNVAILAEDHTGTLISLRESIALMTCIYVGIIRVFDIWVRDQTLSNKKKNYQTPNICPWIKLVSLKYSDMSTPTIFRNDFPRAIFENGELIFEEDDRNLISYNILTAQKVKYQVGPGIIDRFPTIVRFKESLVSISKLHRCAREL